eukprot:scaffold11021_cov132-Isochrysis_galbana.AAC.6
MMMNRQSWHASPKSSRCHTIISSRRSRRGSSSRPSTARTRDQRQAGRCRPAKAANEAVEAAVRGRRPSTCELGQDGARHQGSAKVGYRTRPRLLRSQRVPGVCRQGQQQLASAQASAASEGRQRRVVHGVRAGVPCRLLCRVPPLREGLRQLPLKKARSSSTPADSKRPGKKRAGSSGSVEDGSDDHDHDDSPF